MQQASVQFPGKTITFSDLFGSLLESINPKEAAARPAKAGYVVIRGEIDPFARKYFTEGKVYAVQSTVWQEPSGEACVKVISDMLVPLHILANVYGCAFLGDKAIAVSCDVYGNE